ncbi:MAG: hypothetical protein KF912_03275 [Phycisphaeraceae bacterium]|nr:hypothetical protein [Phycisphaeraceae bacterium]
MSAISQFVMLPSWAKGVMGLSAVGGLLLLANTFGGPKAAGLLMAGLVIIALLLVAYRKLLKLLDKRKADPFTARLRENSAAVPQGISDPSHRAQLDDIRKKFERGLDVFKEHGKDLYSMPWYILVGEPGSGKTEMIRRCNVGFPPGLQDTLQGTGGTVNMNWWFTNHAVILDTAGKLMFDEAPPGQTTVWKELLSLLRKGRPNCPVNGMLLVIPADTLIVDSEEQIQAKAGRIAEQLDGIQRVLGVRFPVFVVISKCDKINGFREFFDSIRDPQLQHQMLGWSNPAELDTPFAPDAVDQHLQTVQMRLRRRRLGLLIDPVHTEDAVNGRRIDQVDAMYAFPDGIMQIAPRLRRYLETIFVAGTWSTKPLFLRGIYFNSALREGDALDADLAAMFNVPIDALPEGKVWEKEKSYFIRDLLMSKVFREKGLVTRANNAKKLQRQRVGILLAASAAAVALSIGLVTYSGVRFRAKIGVHSQYWKSASEVILPSGQSGSLEIWPSFAAVDKEYVASNPPWWDQETAKHLRRIVKESEGDSIRYADVLVSIGERPNTSIEMPAEFRWLRIFGASSPNARQAEAARTAIDQAIIRPALEAARRKVESTGTLSAPAIAEMVRLERLATGAAPRSESAPSAWNMGAIVRDLPLQVEVSGTRSDDPDEISKLVTKLDQATSAAYTGTTGITWPPKDAAWLTRLTMLDTIERAANGLADQVSGGVSGASSVASRVRAVGEAATRLSAAESGEAGLLPMTEFHDARTRVQHDRARNAWSARLTEYVAAKSQLDRALDAIADLEDKPVSEWIATATREVVEHAKSQLNTVIFQTPTSAEAAPETASARAMDPNAAKLASIGDRLAGRLAGIDETTRQTFAQTASRLESMSESSLKKVSFDGVMRRRYDLRSQIYSRADTELVATASARGFSSSASAMTSLDDSLRNALQDIERIARPSVEQPEFKRAVEVSGRAISSGIARRRTDLIDAMIVAIESEPLTQIVASTAIDRFADAPALRIASVPMSRMPGDSVKPEYDPRAAKILFDALSGVGALIESKEAIVVLDAESMRERWRSMGAGVADYTQRYFAEWRRVYTTVSEIDESLSSWPTLLQRIRETPVSEVNRPLADALKRVQEAIQALPADRRATGEPSQLLARVTQEIEQVTDASPVPFTPRAELSRKSLIELSAVARDARREILAMRPVRFEDGILAAYARSENDARRVLYWDNLISHALDVIARESQSGIADAVARVLQQGNRLPISRGAAESLSHAEFESLAASVALIGLAPGTPTGARDEGTIGGGARVDHPGMSSRLERLRGEGSLGANRTLVERVQEVIAAIGAGEPALEYEIFVPPQPAEYGGKWRYYRFHTDRGSSEWYAIDTERARTGQVVRIAQGASLAIEFSPVEAARPRGSDTIETPSGWTLLALAVQRGRQDAADTRIWYVPLSYGGDNTEIGVRFNRQLPPQERWPRSVDWGR